MLRKLFLLLAGVVLMLLGLVGLVLPLMPGVLLLVGAAVCFSLVSPRFRGNMESRLSSHPRYRRALRRWRRSQGLAPWPRLQLAFWLTLRSLLPEPRR